jgi:uncharacterized protein (DUF1499 family)
LFLIHFYAWGKVRRSGHGNKSGVLLLIIMMAVTTNRAGTVSALLVWIGAGVALACALAVVAAGFGNRTGMWDYRAALTALRWSVYIAAGAGVVALAGLALATAARAATLAVLGAVGVLIALVLVLPAWNLQRIANHVPRIHDITTDTEHPPQFVALLAPRQKAPNGAAYGGPKLAKEQQAGYPDIRPVALDSPPAQVFDRALAVAKKMGWEIAAADAAQGRIEATATTFWFGFKDDIVIRITPASNGGSRLDMRSMSRVGRSDIGTNARRIRAFLAALEMR